MKGHDLITTCAVFALDEATHRREPRGDIADIFEMKRKANTVSGPEGE